MLSKCSRVVDLFTSTTLLHFSPLSHLAIGSSSRIIIASFCHSHLWSTLRHSSSVLPSPAVATSTSSSPLAKRNAKKKAWRTANRGFHRRKTILTEMLELGGEDASLSDNASPTRGGTHAYQPSHSSSSSSSYSSSSGHDATHPFAKAAPKPSAGNAPVHSSTSTSSNAASSSASTQRFVRNWSDTGENFCRLCNEPFQTQTEHRSKREHIAIELFFEVIVEYARDWRARNVLLSFDALQLRSKDGEKIRSNNNNIHPAFATFPQLLTLLDERERIDRRQTVYSIARHLADRGAIYLGSRQWAHPLLSDVAMAHEGALVLYRDQHPEVMKCLPSAECAQVSSLTQQCSCMYNLGTVFDFLGLADLIDARDLPNFTSASYAAALAQEAALTAAVAAGVDPTVDVRGRRLSKTKDEQQKKQQQPLNSREMELMSVEDLAASLFNNARSSGSGGSPAVDLDAGFGSSSPLPNSRVEGSELAWYHKGVVLRNVLGQLRWALTEDPKVNHNPIGRDLLLKEPHMKVLAQRLAQSIVAEMIFCRFSEYVTRADTAWRRLGCPTTPLNRAGPLVSNSCSPSRVNAIMEQQKQSAAEALLSSFSSSASPASAACIKQQQHIMLAAAANRQRQLQQQQQQQHAASARSPSHKLSGGRGSQTDARQSSSSSMPNLFCGDKHSHFDHHPASTRAASGCNAAERALLMLHGSYTDALSAVLGMDAGSIEFLSGGKPVADHSRSRFLSQEQSRTWTFAELERMRFESHQHELKMKKHAAEVNARKEKLQQVALQQQNVNTAVSPVALSPTPQQPALRPLPRVSGTHLSATAERLLSEASGICQSVTSPSYATPCKL